MIKLAKPTFYITTAIDYTNAPPHIGHAYEKIAADVQARWKRSQGYDVFFLTGTDEHGLKVQRAAEAAKTSPKKFVDKITKEFKDAWKALNISYDQFIRTTDKEHEKAAAELIKLAKKKVNIYKSTYEGLYCVGCERFLTEKDLVEGKCPYHKKKPEKVSEDSYFFKLSAYQDRLLKLYKENPEFISPPKIRTEIINRVKEGLKDLSITRTSFTWGIPFPLEKGHVIYVWFDALPNYITALGWPSGANFKKYWPADVHHIGKDITWFHCVIWPAILMSAGIELPKKVFSHGWLTIDNQKISKSLGNVIDPRWLVKKYGADVVRFYILRETPYGDDGDFSEKTLAARLNSDLADTLGNLVSRSLTLIQKFADGKVPKQGNMFSTEDLNLGRAAEKALRNANAYMNKLEYHHALDEIWTFLKAANKYIDEQKPWTIKEKERLNTVLYTLAEALRHASALTWPFIPETAEEIAKQLGINKVPQLENLEWGKLKPGTKTQKGKILFKKIEAPKVKSKQKPKEVKNKKPMVSFKDWQKLDLRVGKITEVEDVEGSDKLYKIKIDVGEIKQTAAGLKEYFAPDELMGKKVVFLVNLEPATLRGIKSEGMILAAVKGKNVTLLQPEIDIEIGAKVE